AHEIHTYFLLIIPPPLSPKPFPYTTLFRSPTPAAAACSSRAAAPAAPSRWTSASPSAASQAPAPPTRRSPPSTPTAPLSAPPTRSEEHTSELQSRENLVCRLLLEKKEIRID